MIPFKEKKGKSQAITIIIACIILVFIGHWVLSPDRVSQRDDASSSIGYDNSVEYTLSASDLSSSYHENEVVADRKYKGKRITVTGTVTVIAKNVMNEPYITLNTENLFMPIHCQVTEDDASRISKGESISITGTCGGMIMNSVFLKNCTF